MTITTDVRLDAPLAAAGPAVVQIDEPEGFPPPPEQVTRVARARRRIVVVAVVVAALVGIVATHRLVVADVMQRNRQRHLASDFAARKNTVGAGDAVAVLQIEKIGLNQIVAEGDTAEVLRGGPGHIAGTPLPGEGGHSVIVGRRSRYGGAFGRLDELEPGDRIVVQVRNGAPIAYQVRDKQRVDGGTPVEATGEQLTLVTATGPLSRSVLAVSADPEAVTSGDPAGVPAPTANPAVFAPAAQRADYLVLLIRVAVLAALLVLSWRVRQRMRPVVCLAVFGPTIALALVQLLDLEPIFGRLY
jgi:LPXTG-site transpeptidase (sortase) family protein